MFKRLLCGTAALLLLAGCGVSPTGGMSARVISDSAAFGADKKIPQVFDHLIGMISLLDDQQHPGTKWLDFEFGTQGLIFSDAVRKQATFTVNGKDFEGGYGVLAAEDGKLYIPRMEKGNRTGYYVLGTWTKPADLKTIAFRQKCAIKFDMPHTYTVKRPLNPMAHITFVIDLKSTPVLATTEPTPVTLKN